MAAIKFIILFSLFAFINAKAARQSQELVDAVERFIEERRPHINQRYRLHYHVAGPVGWINDPNGFSFYKGEYHLFYQFYPYASHWGPMHWGHVVSPDLANWQQLPTALVPEEEYCFSGSAVENDGQLVLMYTGHVEGHPPNQSQYLAFSDDGIRFNKYRGNPVIPHAPNHTPDFRDPKTWKHGDYWYSVIGSKFDDNRGNVLLYRSRDLFDWEFLSVLAESDGSGRLGYMWECPDFFELDGKFILLVSPQFMEPDGDKYRNLHQTGYFIGSFDYNTFEYKIEVGFQEVDNGHDFYAAQTTDDPQGRRYLVSWFQMWDQEHPEEVDGWSGSMTLVRELKLEGNRILQKPVEAMEGLRINIDAPGEWRTHEDRFFDKTAELIVEGDLNEDIELVLTGTEGGRTAWIRWNSRERKVIVDKGNHDPRQAEWNPIGKRSWRIFLDASSLELFCGEGELVFSSRVFPEGGWKVTNLSHQTLRVESYKLRRSVPV